jgi:hypothetical protein
MMQAEDLVLRVEALTMQVEERVLQVEQWVLQEEWVLQVEERVLQVEERVLQVEEWVLQVEGRVLQVQGRVLQVQGLAMQVEGLVYQYAIHVSEIVPSIHHWDYQYQYCWFAPLGQVRRGTGILQHLLIGLFSISGYQEKKLLTEICSTVRTHRFLCLGISNGIMQRPRCACETTRPVDVDTGEVIISTQLRYPWLRPIPSYFDLPIPVGYWPNNTDRYSCLHLSCYCFCDWVKILPSEGELSEN